jgi:hypothetical protein
MLLPCRENLAENRCSILADFRCCQVPVSVVVMVVVVTVVALL